MIVVFLEMLRAVFSLRYFTMNEPKPRRYTFSPCARLSLIEVISPSTTARTFAFSMPVVLAISVTISAFVILFFEIGYAKLAKNPDIWNNKLPLAASKGGRNFWNFEHKSAEQLFTGLLHLAILRLLAIITPFCKPFIAPLATKLKSGCCCRE